MIKRRNVVVIEGLRGEIARVGLRLACGKVLYMWLLRGCGYISSGRRGSWSWWRMIWGLSEAPSWILQQLRARAGAGENFVCI